ncbi:MAG: coiled coil domain-containing protein [Nitrospira sp.]|nr:coiled coil domain-containing protein [Nitrospira sp.]
MSDKALYQQKIQAQLDEWKADVDKLKAKASGASADAQLHLDQQVKNLESKVAAGQAKLAEVTNASEEAWNSLKGGVESAWESLQSKVKDAAGKLQK